LKGLRNIVGLLSTARKTFLAKADLNALLYSQDGLSGFSSSSAQGLRQFSFDEEEPISNNSGPRQVVDKIFVPDLFTFLRRQEYDDIVGRGLISRCNCPFCQSGGNRAGDKHYIYRNTMLVEGFKSLDLAGRAVKSNEVIERAKQAYASLGDAFVPLHRQSQGDFITALEQAFPSES
jgi:hypothetical protein